MDDRLGNLVNLKPLNKFSKFKKKKKKKKTTNNAGNHFKKVNLFKLRIKQYTKIKSKRN